MSSIASEDPVKLKELAAIRTQGLIGMFVLFMTVVTMIYHARPVDASVHQNTADSVLIALGDARADLENLFAGTALEHNLTLLRRYATFGHDFIPGWMLFIMFL